ncbi:MAG: restriction endonuclease subunit S [Acidimicrobiia bacterium]|nr:restriction endonuclease subunit S [Acidimicrobiia bacterium]
MTVETAPLGEVATIERATVQPDFIPDGETYVGLENITTEGSFSEVGKVAAGELKSGKFRFDDGHLLYGKLRPYLSKIAAPSFSGVCSTDILPLRAGPRVDRKYLLHFLRTPEMVGHASKLATGANLPRLSPKALAAFSIPLPSIEEQRRIAAVLDAADALRAKRRLAIAKLDSLTQAIFIDMFGSSGWDAWPSQTVESLAAPGTGTIRTGPFGSQLLHEEFVEEGIAVLGIDNAVQNRFAWGKRRYITEEKYAELKRFTVNPGDVLVTIMGTCGRSAVVPDGIPTSINTKHLCCVTVDQDVCLPEWLWACLRFHPAVLDQLGSTHGAVMPGLNMGKIKRAEIPIPPLSNQRRFVEAMAASTLQREASDASRDQIETLFASLQQRAYRAAL